MSAIIRTVENKHVVAIIAVAGLNEAPRVVVNGVVGPASGEENPLISSSVAKGLRDFREALTSL